MVELSIRFEPPVGAAALPPLASSRARILARALDALATTPAGAIPQHRLWIGAAGMGKSLLLRALATGLAARGTDWTSALLPAELGEVRDLDALWRVAAQVTGVDTPFLATKGARRMVLLVDDLDRVLARMSTQHWELREVLSERTDIALVGTALRIPEAVYAYDAAFYDYFAIDELGPFSGDDARTFIDATVPTPPPAATVRTLNALLGGTPRHLAAARDALSAGAVDVADALGIALDRATPTVLAVLDTLSEQARAVLLALTNSKEPATAADLATRLAMPSNKVSAYLNRLGNDGLVDKVPAPDARGSGYQVGDRTLALVCRARSGDGLGVLDDARRLATAWSMVDADAAARSAALAELLGARAATITADPERIAALPPELREVARALTR